MITESAMIFKQTFLLKYLIEFKEDNYFRDFRKICILRKTEREFSNMGIVMLGW